jgi:hypothetical protein
MDIRTARRIANKYGLDLIYQVGRDGGFYTMTGNVNPTTRVLWSHKDGALYDFFRAELERMPRDQWDNTCREYAAQCVDFTPEQVAQYEQLLRRTGIASK